MRSAGLLIIASLLVAAIEPIYSQPSSQQLAQEWHGPSATVGAGYGWGSMGAVQFDMRNETSRVPFAVSITSTFPLIRFGSLVIVAAHCGITTGVSFINQINSSFAEYISIDVGVPALLGFQLGGAHHPDIPIAVSFSVGPSYLYEKRQVPGGLAWISLTEVFLAEYPEWRVRLFYDIQPAEIPGELPNSRRYLRNYNLQVAWSAPW
ncbi:MAG: hypothetical protein MUC47_04875 [Candidatus Kapabacteria bacterium]|nr:hypothetical protein [Candidatus Kapabacteria bacterium]